jgi:hypothetical protein
MDYVARAREAARQWREAQGLEPAGDLISDTSFISSLPREENAPLRDGETLAREENTKQTKKTIKEREERDRRLAAALVLDPSTVREVLGAQPDPHDLAIVKFEVLEAVRLLETGIRTGVLPPRCLIRGRPLCDWLHLDEVAWLLRMAKTPRSMP